MSRYIGAGQNDRFDVRMQELVSKAKNPGGQKQPKLGIFEGTKYSESSHQTGHFGPRQYIGTLILC